MDVLEQVAGKEFLGREFLTWLWFRSETRDGHVSDSSNYELWLHNRVSLKSDGEGKKTETVTCQGENPDLREARLALAEGKKIFQGKFLLINAEDEWQFTLDSSWLNFKTLKTPKVIVNTKEDPDGLFYEKVHLLNQPLEVIRAVFQEFILLRISPEWEEGEVPKIKKWIKDSCSS